MKVLFFREPSFAKFIHGQDGLGEENLPAPSIKPSDTRVAELIVSKIMDSPGEITLVPLGPLTNIAKAL